MLRLLHKLKNKPVLARWLFYLCLALALLPFIVSKNQLSAEVHSMINAIRSNTPHNYLFGHETWLAYVVNLNFISAEKLLIAMSIGITGFAAELRCRQKGISAVNALIVLPIVIGQLLLLGHITAFLAIGVAFIGFIILDYRLPKWLYFFLPLLFGLLVFAINPPILPAFILLIIIDFIIVRKEEKRLAIVGSTLALSAFLLLQDVVLPNISPSFSSASIQNISNQPQRWFQYTWTIVLMLLFLTEITRAKRWTYSGRSFALAGLCFLFLAILFQDSSQYANVWWFMCSISLSFLLLSEMRKVWQRILIILLMAIWLPLFISNAFTSEKTFHTIQAQQFTLALNPLIDQQPHSL
ncbi:MAG: hypothetical protein LAT54_00625 [Cryomorphaceae bacterium]|nr:hypothetical protein [Cryomorphaceae bacterium]